MRRSRFLEFFGQYKVYQSVKYEKVKAAYNMGIANRACRRNKFSSRSVLLALVPADLIKSAIVPRFEPWYRNWADVIGRRKILAKPHFQYLFVSSHYMTDHNDITNEEDIDDLEDISFSDLTELDLKTIDENVSYNIFEDNFPQCTITRLGDKLLIRIEEHIYTKYWFHKYHASVFATAMMKAIKRLQLEGVPFSDEELDEDDEVHIFVRWTLTEPSTIDSKTLSENINLAFDSVFERANSMLENSDSVLILGKDTGEGLDLLKRIQTHLDNLGFYTYIIKEQPDIIGESVMQKVLRFGLSSRFVIIENSEPTGHLYEFPHITKFAELTSIVLQRQGEGATWMFEDLYHKINNIKKFEYTNDNLEEQINEGINWAKEYAKSFGDYQKHKLPWFNK